MMFHLASKLFFEKLQVIISKVFDMKYGHVLVIAVKCLTGKNKISPGHKQAFLIYVLFPI